jgi:hypothetical protein
MEIRTFERGDEAAQAAIYNEAAGGLPKFKPAKLEEVKRRTAAADFDASTRFFAIEGGRPVAYVSFAANGRVSFPWCQADRQDLADPIFEHMIQEMRRRGLRKTFAAYRGDWPTVLDFFRQRGFALAREMVNFVVDIGDLPTITAQPRSAIVPMVRADVPALFALAPHVLRSGTADDLERHLFDNPYFPPSAVFVLRSRRNDSIWGAGVFVQNRAYADPVAVDPAMPCFRLGAFGTEGMQTKRINGLFSLLCRDDAQCAPLGMDLMEHAASAADDGNNIKLLAGQVPSDAPSLLRFYQMNWRRQGSFPVLEKAL